MKKEIVGIVGLLLVVVIGLSILASKQGATLDSTLGIHRRYCPGCHKEILIRQDMIKQCPKCGYMYHIYKSDFIDE